MPRDCGVSTAAARVLRTLLWLAVVVLGMALLGGMGDGTLPALRPTFGLDHGAGEARPLGLLTGFVAGRVAFQWPVGSLVDKVSERILIPLMGTSLARRKRMSKLYDFLFLAGGGAPAAWAHNFMRAASRITELR